MAGTDTFFTNPSGGGKAGSGPSSTGTPSAGASEWGLFPGGELEGRRPRALCPECRARLRAAAAGQGPVFRPKALCFACYRAGIERERVLKAAGELDTASTERFQFVLPLEPVNRPRLQMLKAERAAVRGTPTEGPEEHAARRRHAQVVVRQAFEAATRTRPLSVSDPASAREARARAMAAAIHAAELQLPESWIPFVVAG